MKGHKMATLAWGLAILMILAGCGKRVGDTAQPTCGKGVTSVLCLDMMKGQIAGRAWSFRFGTAVQPVGSDTWMVALHEKDPGGDPCAAKMIAAPGNEIYSAHFHLKELKAGPLDFSMGGGKGAVTLSKTSSTGTGIANDSTVAFGTGKIQSVSANEFSGRLDVRGDDKNVVNGQFIVRLCR